MAEQPNSAPAAASTSKKSKLPLLLGVVAVMLLLAGGEAWFFLHAHKPSQVAAQKTEKKEADFIVHLDSFTVNLADPEENHFLRITMDLGLAHAPKGDAGKEGADASGFPTAQARDTILSVLSASKAADLLTSEGKTQLKHNLVAALREKVPDIEARDVYFTEFLVQR